MHDDYNPQEIEDRKAVTKLERFCVMSIDEQIAEIRRLAGIQSNGKQQQGDSNDDNSSIKGNV